MGCRGGGQDVVTMARDVDQRWELPQAQRAAIAALPGFQCAVGDGLCAIYAFGTVHSGRAPPRDGVLRVRSEVRAALQCWKRGSGKMREMLGAWGRQSAGVKFIVNEELSALMTPDAWLGDVSFATLAMLRGTPVRVWRVELEELSDDNPQINPVLTENNDLLDVVNALLLEQGLAYGERQVVWWTRRGKGVHFDTFVPELPQWCEEEKDAGEFRDDGAGASGDLPIPDHVPVFAYAASDDDAGEAEDEDDETEDDAGTAGKVNTAAYAGSDDDAASKGEMPELGWAVPEVADDGQARHLNSLNLKGLRELHARICPGWSPAGDRRKADTWRSAIRDAIHGATRDDDGALVPGDGQADDTVPQGAEDDVCGVGARGTGRRSGRVANAVRQIESSIGKRAKLGEGALKKRGGGARVARRVAASGDGEAQRKLQPYGDVARPGYTMEHWQRGRSRYIVTDGLTVERLSHTTHTWYYIHGKDRPTSVVEYINALVRDGDPRRKKVSPRDRRDPRDCAYQGEAQVAEAERADASGSEDGCDANPRNEHAYNKRDSNLHEAELREEGARRDRAVERPVVPPGYIPYEGQVEGAAGRDAGNHEQPQITAEGEVGKATSSVVDSPKSDDGPELGEVQGARDGAIGAERWLRGRLDSAVEALGSGWAGNCATGTEGGQEPHGVTVGAMRDRLRTLVPDLVNMTPMQTLPTVRLEDRKRVNKMLDAMLGRALSGLEQCQAEEDERWLLVVTGCVRLCAECVLAGYESPPPTKDAGCGAGATRERRPQAASEVVRRCANGEYHYQHHPDAHRAEGLPNKRRMVKACVEAEAFEARRRERQKLEKLMVAAPFVFWRKVLKNEPLTNQTFQPEFPVAELVNEAKRQARCAGQRGVGERGAQYLQATEEEAWQMRQTDEAEVRVQARRIILNAGGNVEAPSVPWDTSAVDDNEVRRAVRRRNKASSPGWDGLRYGWWGLGATSRALARLAEWTVQRSTPLKCSAKVIGKFIPKPGKSAEEYKHKRKAWRNIGKGLCSVKVLHSVRTTRRRAFMERNGYWNAADPQKGNKARVAACAVHISDLTAAQRCGASGELGWIDYSDGFPSCSPALMQASEEMYQLPNGEREYWRKYDDMGETQVFLGDKEIWAGRVLCGTTQGAIESPDRFCMAAEIPLRASDDRCLPSRMEVGGVRKKSRKGLLDDNTIMVRRWRDLEKELQTLDGDCTSVNFLLNADKCMTGSMKKGRFVAPKEERNVLLRGRKVPAMMQDGEELARFLGAYFGDDRKIDAHFAELLEEQCAKIDAVNVREWAKVLCYRDYLIPSWRYILSVQPQLMRGAELDALETITNKYLRKWLSLPKSCPAEFLYKKRGGLGLPSLLAEGGAAAITLLTTFANSADPEGRRALETIVRTERRPRSLMGVAYALWSNAEQGYAARSTSKAGATTEIIGRKARWRELRRVAAVGKQKIRTARAAAVAKERRSVEQRRQMQRRRVVKGKVQEAERMRVETEEARTLRDAGRPATAVDEFWEGEVNPNAKKCVSRAIEAHRLDRALQELRVGGEWFQLSKLEGEDERWGRMVGRTARKAREWAVRAAARQLPDARNLKHWGGKSYRCICGQRGTDKHILSNCPSMLDRYAWRHDSVLRLVVDRLREWGGDAGWEVVSDLRDEPLKTQGWLRNEGVLTDRRVDVLAVLRAGGRVKRVVAVELSIAWEELTTGHHAEDEWAAKAAKAGRRWTNSIDRRAAAKGLKYERDVLETFPAQWRTSVVTIEVGARGIVTAGVVKRLSEVCTWMSPRNVPQKGGPRRRAAALAVELGERAVLGSYVVWQKRAQQWDETRLLQTTREQPWEERPLAEIDARRQAQQRRREEKAGTVKAEWRREEDDADAAYAEAQSDDNALWRDGLIARRTEAEADEEATRIYTDGSYAEGRAGWGWVAVRGSRVLAERRGAVVVDTNDPRCVGCQFHSNNAGEVSAVVHAMLWVASEEGQEGGPITVIPDSWWAIRAAKGLLPRHHTRAARQAAELAERTSVLFGWVKGHSKHKWNNRADDLANEGREGGAGAVEDRGQQPVVNHGDRRIHPCSAHG